MEITNGPVEKLYQIMARADAAREAATAADFALSEALGAAIIEELGL
jgi:hypothetical protein